MADGLVIYSSFVPTKSLYMLSYGSQPRCAYLENKRLFS